MFVSRFGAPQTGFLTTDRACGTVVRPNRSFGSQCWSRFSSDLPSRLLAAPPPPPMGLLRAPNNTDPKSFPRGRNDDVQIGPTSSNFADVVNISVKTQFGRRRPNLADFDQLSPRSTELRSISTKCGRIRPNLTDCVKFGRSFLNLAEFGQFRVLFDQAWPKSFKFGPMLSNAETCQIWTEFDQTLTSAEFDHVWAKFDNIEPTSAKSLRSRTSGGGFRRKLADVYPDWTTLAGLGMSTGGSHQRAVSTQGALAARGFVEIQVGYSAGQRSCPECVP